VRSYVVNHQLANDELNINEENKVLMKLNDELRSGTPLLIQKSTRLTTSKSSKLVCFLSATGPKILKTSYPINWKNI